MIVGLAVEWLIGVWRFKQGISQVDSNANAHGMLFHSLSFT